MQQESFQLLFVGDVMLGRLVNDMLRAHPPEYPWGDTLPLFHAADVRLCNLECALTSHETPWNETPKVFHFRSDPRNVRVLRAAGINAVSLANNHSLDFTVEGLYDTLRLLREAGIYAAGAGYDTQDAAAPVRWQAGSTTIGLLACTDNEPAWAATSTRAGTCYVPIDSDSEQAQRLLQSIERVKPTVDVLIISLHWGPNWGYEPPETHPPFAHALIDAGADIIFGHSGHVVRGIEIYRQKPILYCTGDFIDDYAIDPVERNDYSGIFVVSLEQKVIRQVAFYPTVIEDFRALRAQGAERTCIAQNMQRLCTLLHTDTHWNEQAGRVEIRIPE
ncbi:poly-gamma-glutamate synthesis protein (capsule biosynthesis protein) [Thermosporothrix hazakensis]|jgi:poly-gamma-glutamate synthesis protein (capsule biosynthesis protein)|uniref:Poly-gamma-glutamate synthesis protein (Capsule biosynthesis protein) n=2 Tax=Thermosporothrix TaxID=768650 RepID=A0A326U5V0_THEHA|nr:CapA family protein [Thermosporothrix hazakensis]PZW29346.1 poly-gamma-glutamate synthesis protein (capsule biosynthesis protein) [Thermosporothrix hazakensis]BBH86276.1 hypothetical protein KTC_10270 [Thermosporothrix sp. COM3]GCE45303.1 hypothetical protein KTH_01720 [Thermosporothrix hazakensis]